MTMYIWSLSAYWYSQICHNTVFKFELLIWDLFQKTTKLRFKCISGVF